MSHVNYKTNQMSNLEDPSLFIWNPLLRHQLDGPDGDVLSKTPNARHAKTKGATIITKYEVQHVKGAMFVHYSFNTSKTHQDINNAIMATNVVKLN